MGTKVVTVRRNIFRWSDQRKLQKTIRRMERRGYTYVNTAKTLGGYQLMFQKQDPARTR